MISVTNLSKEFKVKTKEPGLKGSLKSIIKPNYKEITAVNHIDLQVDKGEVLAFIGPNGAGKSTTIKMLTGILTPTSGNILVDGFDPTKQRQKLAYNIGTVFGQKSQLWFHLPPLDSLKLLGKIYELSSNEIDYRIEELQEIFEIEELMNIPVRKLSLGQRIRCEIAASLLHKPKIIFLDEPTIGLDVVVKKKIRELIKRVNQEEQTTVFLTSHDATDIEELCKRVVIINHGEIVTDRTVKSLKYNYLNKKVFSLLYQHPVTLADDRFTILKQKGTALKVEIDTSEISADEAINQLLALDNVMDMTIEDAPLEEIIGMIYTKEKEGSHEVKEENQ